MVAFTINGVAFDTTARPGAIVHGYDAAARAALTGDTLIKVRNLASKSNLDAKLTKGLQVSTFNPADMKDSTNFFNFVSQWEAVILQMETHLKTYYMESPFTLFTSTTAPVPEDQMTIYEFEIGEYLRDQNIARLAGAVVAADSYTVTSAGGTLTTVNRPAKPTGAYTIDDGGDILREWHNMSLKEVLHSVELQLKFVADDVHRQNLVWSFTYMMDCLDANLKNFVLSKISKYPAELGRTGPVVFIIVAKRILQTTENLAQKVINGFIALRLTHFENENVIEAIFTVRNVLKFLRYGEANTFAPRTTIVLIYDVFRGTSVGAFRAYVQQAQDIVLKDVTDPEIIFDHLQSKYEELLLADRWVATKKRQTAFTFGGGDTKSYADHDKEKPPKKEEDSPKDDDDKKKKKRPTHDKSGRKIDYKPPGPNASHERQREDGTKEFWCGKCGRWGSHLTDKHDEWRKNFRQNRNRNGNNNNNNNNANNNNDNNGTARGSVTFASATTGPTRLAMDSDLVNGVDL